IERAVYEVLCRRHAAVEVYCRDDRLVGGRDRLFVVEGALGLYERGIQTERERNFGERPVVADRLLAGSYAAFVQPVAKELFGGDETYERIAEAFEAFVVEVLVGAL